MRLKAACYYTFTMAENGVSFDDDPLYDPTPVYAVAKKKSSFITGLVIKSGIASSEKEANIILIVFILACVFLSVVVYIAVQPHPHPLSREQLQRDLDRMHATERLYPGK
jgi:hypothetical protein